MANTETVEIIIEGTDNSVDAFASATQNMGQFAAESKSATGAMAKVFSLAGAGPLASFVNDAKDASDTFHKINSMLQSGGRGAALIKAGLVIAVPVAVYQITRAIDDWVTGVAAWKKEMAEAIEEIGKSNDFLNTKAKEQFDHQLKLVQLTTDEVAKEAELVAMRDELDAKISDQLEKVQAEKQALEESAGWLKSWGKGYEENLAMHEKGVELAKADLELLQAQRQEVQAIVGAKAQELKDAQERFAQEKALADLRERDRMASMTDSERRQAEAAKKFGAGADEAMAMEDRLAEPAKLKERQQAEADYWKMVAEQEEAAADRQERYVDSMRETAAAFKEAFAEQEDADWDVIENLKLAQVELKQGEDAAYRMSLAMQGISKPAIDAAAAIRQQNEALEEQKRVKDSILGDAGSIMQRMLDDLGKAAPSLSAKESRFLTRGTAGGDPMAKMALTTEQMKDIAKKALSEATANRESAQRQEELLKVMYVEVGT